ncbi:hypothetical protein [Paludibacter sp.]|uniref:hypothetical protein n=1 Tax=Paludibacter sp. TaxID=1898105 RepID=UPI00135254EC|nr:hypothetical protein [Paludibacter sp.]MTK52428.1 hypothetical protein [Paludibacter sp.]
MKIRLFLSILSLISLFINTHFIYAEDAKTDTTTAHSFQASVTTGNNQINMGKKQEANILYIKPALHYSYKEGLFADFSCAYFPTFNKSSIDNFAVGIGYNFNLGSNLSSSLGYTFTKYYSNKEVSASSPNELSTSFGWDNPVIAPSLNLSYSFGSIRDIYTGLELSHSLDFDHIFCSSDKLSIPLSVTTSFGTTNFYKEYVKQNKITKKVTKVNAKANGKAKNNTGSTTTTTEVVDYTTINTKYTLTGLAFGTSVSYTIANLSLTPSVSYQIPFNQPSDLKSSRSIIVSFQIAYSF